MKEFLEKRIQELGFTPDQLTFKSVDQVDGVQTVTYSLLSHNAQGDILIPYFTLEGQPDTYKKTDNPGNPMVVQYRVVRKREVKDDKDKYNNPAGQPLRIYHTPSIIHKYREGEAIETLYLIEGQFKALAGWGVGLDIVGLSGKIGWKIKGEKRLHNDILDIIDRCQVRNLVLLLDADTRMVKQKYVEEGRDLSARFWDFLNTVKAFQESTRTVNVHPYFAQVHESFMHSAKGLDDLLNQKRKRGKVDEVLDFIQPQNLILRHNRNSLFQGLDLMDTTYWSLKRFFRLDNAEMFWYTYSEIIEDAEFLWCKGVYQKTEKELVVLKDPNREDYLRIGVNWYKKVPHMTGKGEIVKNTLKNWAKSEITTDHGKKILSQIEKYDAMVNVPNNDPRTYQQSFQIGESQLYNLYKEPAVEPKEGKWPTIQKLLIHLFGETEIQGKPRWVVALDWITILYRYPTRKLPVPCLVSTHNETGKTTFIDLLRMVFGENVVEVGNSDLKQEFNAHYASALVVALNEGLIEKRENKEKIKSMTTDSHINYRAMHSNPSPIENNIKMVITSNHVTKFLPIEEEDTRFFVVEVPPIQKSSYVKNHKQKMREETPAFCHDLQHRKIVFPDKTRTWFDHDVIRTPEFYRAAGDNKSSLHRNLENVVRAYMLDFKTLEANFTISYLHKALEVRTQYDKANLSRLIKDTLKVQEPKGNSWKIVYSWGVEVLTQEVDKEGSQKYNRAVEKSKKSRRWYTFTADQFLKPEEIEIIKTED